MKKSRIFNLITIISVLFTTTIGIQQAFADAIIDVADQLSDTTISTAADHTVTFTLPAGVVFSDEPGAGIDTDVIKVDFHDDFDVAGTFATSDFTFNDGTSRTVGSVFNDFTFPLMSCGSEICITVDQTNELFFIVAGSGYVEETAPLTITFTVNGTSPDGTLTAPAVAGSYALNIAFCAGSALNSCDGDFQNTHSGVGAIAITDSNEVTISANVDPVITFDIDTLVADSESGAPYTVDLGILTTTPVSSGTTIFSIWLDLDTNASGGAVVTVKNANGPSGLVSTSVLADNIPSADANQDPSVANYGICVISAAESGTEPGTFAAAATYQSGLCAVDGVNNDVGGLLVTSTPLLNTANAPIAEGRARISVNAAISGVTPAHNDYTDTLTFIATGTF